MMRTGYLNTLREVQTANAAKDGYRLSGASLGVQFVAGFFPIPTLGASWEKVNLNYSVNNKERALNNGMVGANGRTLDPTEIAKRLPDYRLATDGSVSFIQTSGVEMRGNNMLFSVKDKTITIKPGAKINITDITNSTTEKTVITVTK